MSSQALALLLVACSCVDAFRMKKNSHSGQAILQGKLIAGVPVLNYEAVDQADEHGIGSASLADVEGQRDWIVMLRSDVTEAQLAGFCESSKISCTPEGHVGLTPFVEVRSNENELKELLEAHADEIEFVEPDVPTYAIPELPVDGPSAKSQATWGLNKIGKTASTGGGEGVHVYVADTGVRTTHQDFGGRAIPTLEYLGTSPKVCNGDTSCANDVHGHGTHCAGTVGGTKYGVASKATLHGVKVLADSGSGSVSWIVGAIDWIVANGQRPAVISMSLGGGGRAAAYQRSIDMATSKGVTVVVAAGNNNADACNYSPAYVPSAITVGSTDSRDARSGFSNKGKCLSIYAPGSGVQSAGHRSDSARATMSGTSMACPHVAGAAALLLEQDPSMSPAVVLQTMLDKAASNTLTGITNTCPNKLLWVGAGSGDSKPAPTPAPTPAPDPNVLWAIGTRIHPAETCDQVCATKGSTCSQTALNDLNGKGMAYLKEKYALAGYTCSGLPSQSCNGGNNCQRWGSPYIHNSHHHGNSGSCWGGSSPSVAPCGQRPSDGNHRRLCPCVRR